MAEVWLVWLSWLEPLSRRLKGCRFNPWSGCLQEGKQLMFLSVSVSLSLPLSFPLPLEAMKIKCPRVRIKIATGWLRSVQRCPACPCRGPTRERGAAPCLSHRVDVHMMQCRARSEPEARGQEKDIPPLPPSLSGAPVRQ